MDSASIREAFFRFFESKAHVIVPSAPMVIKNDPTLMFTNAGMNQFKDLFLGNSPVKNKRVADTQKCLRVSGKHNDLEEVGHDTYHHTMFEMLGNWSFGDYFKKEAIEYAWEFLTDVLKIDKSRLYATYFEGSTDDNLDPDNEALNHWKKYLPEEHIIPGSKKDNFWEMGDTGPCGPCSEVHIDLRDENEIAKLSGRQLVNKSNPLVIEIWNLVFIQFDRKANYSLHSLPDKHVDTGMGFERLCMVMQHKKSNYDTDVFQPIIKSIEKISGKKYGSSKDSDVAMRVIADHLRAVSFAIADNQLPSNTGAGYVIRRILRRAIRYGFTYLDLQEAFIYKLVSTLEQQMGRQFNELTKNKGLIEKVIQEEENSFLKTLATGIQKFEQYLAKHKETLIKKHQDIPGSLVFELYDTYGFPADLTRLLARENDLNIDEEGFEKALEEQKNRSRSATSIEAGDWKIISNTTATEFLGYDSDKCEVNILRWRKVVQKGKELFHVVVDKTPFYAESGGQTGDHGTFSSEQETLQIIDTRKENNLWIHVATTQPSKTSYIAIIDSSKRRMSEANHSATHLLHHALRHILGNHVEQKGSLVSPDYLRFDFAHFQKMTDDEIKQVEQMVNHLIFENFKLKEQRNVSYEQALEQGAIALFGEKYGNEVRVIGFGKSVELCGGTHVKSTAEIGLFKISSESAIAAGIRRIEALTSLKAFEYLNQQHETLKNIEISLNRPKDSIKTIVAMQEEISTLKKQIDVLQRGQLKEIKANLLSGIKKVGNCNLIIAKVESLNPNLIKDLAFQLKAEQENLCLALACDINGKPNITIMISDNLTQEKNLDARQIIKAIAPMIKGGGGGQPFYATAGGSNPDGLNDALKLAEEIFSK